MLSKRSFVFVTLIVFGPLAEACGDGEVTAAPPRSSATERDSVKPFDVDGSAPGANWWDLVDKPDASNTGPRNPDAIRNIGSCPIITTPGTTLEDFQCTGKLSVEADNVTLRNFIIHVDGQWSGVELEAGVNGLLMEDGELDGDSSSCAALVQGMGWTGRRLHLHHCDDCLKPDTQLMGLPAGGPVEMTNSYCHDAVGGHGDGVQTWELGGQPLLFRHNTIEGGITSAFIIHRSPDAAGDFKIHNNWLSGGSFTVYCGGHSDKVQVHDNLFGRDSQYGPAYDDGPCDWSGNLYWDDFTLVPHPRPHQ